MSIDHPDFSSPTIAGSQQLLVVTTGSVSSPGVAAEGPLDVSSYERVLVQIQASLGGASQYEVTFNSSAGGPQVGPIFGYNSASQATANIYVAPVSAFLTVQITNNSGSAQTYAVNVYGQTGEQDLALLVPPTSFTASVASLGAGLFSNGTPFAMPAGPATLYVRGVGGAAQCFLQQWNGASWQDIAGLTTPAVGPGTTGVIVPVSDSRLVLGNPTAAAQNIEAAVVAQQ